MDDTRGSRTGSDNGSHRLLAASRVPGDLFQTTPQRLALASGVLAGTYLVAIVLKAVLLHSLYGVAPAPFTLWVMGFSVALSGLVFAASRMSRLSPGALLNIGVGYEVVICMGVSIVEVMRRAPGTEVWGVSWVTAMVVFFPFLLPAPPGKTLGAAFASASTGPLAYMLVVTLGIRTASLSEFLAMYIANYLAAGMAVVPAIVLSRLGREVKKAQELGSYRMVKLLGKGGMGQVWRAEHRMLARPAAIKLIRPDAIPANRAEGQLVLKRFEREAQATAQLQSPHSIELYDFGTTDEGSFYYVMELLDGVDLKTLVQRFGTLPADRAIFMLMQACESLADAHHLGLVHRDVKPANLYVCRKGLQVDFIKVLDFGLVITSHDAPERDIRLTQAGSATGTPAFMAPEMVVSHGDVDGRADIYALGCVAYWLVTGTMVFEGRNPTEVLLNHMNKEPVPPRQRAEVEIPEELERIILQCLQKKPEDRPQSMVTLKEMLAAVPVGDWTADTAMRWWGDHLPAHRDSGAESDSSDQTVVGPF